MSTTCIFCRIIRAEIPCHKVFESERIFAFMDINPLSLGHVLVIPKHHAAMMHELPDADASELGLSVKRVAKSLHQQFPDMQYNVLQNNGRMAHQLVDHVHFHIIPRPSTEQGLNIEWNSLPTDHTILKKQAEDLAKYFQ